MQIFDMIEQINKNIKKREERDFFYDYMAKARKINCHEDYIEYVYETISQGKNLIFAVKKASKDLEL
jgi:hypothetical protein